MKVKFYKARFIITMMLLFGGSYLMQHFFGSFHWPSAIWFLSWYLAGQYLPFLKLVKE